MLWSWSFFIRPWSLKRLSIFWYHTWGDYFKLYKAFFNLQNKCSFQGFIKPFSWCLNICSCNSPCKNMVLTSKWLMFQLHCDASIHTNRIMLHFTTGAKVSIESKPFNSSKPLSIILAFNFSTFPLVLYFFLYTHFEYIGLFPSGRSWSVQVLFLWI